jgi:membrane protease subunit HflC
MKPNPVNLTIGALLLLIFVLMLFAFQVRQNELAVVTTFGEYARAIEKPGLNARLPWPIQKVYKFDNRIQSFERRFEQTTTSDGINIVISVYTGWRIRNPKVFLESFSGDVARADQALEQLISGIKIGVISQHPFSDLISTNAAMMKFDDVEGEMLAGIKNRAEGNYGIHIEFLGIKQIGLPESISSKVFDRMAAERQTKVRQYQAEGEREARIIRAEADSQARKILAEARAAAIEMSGAAEARANEYYRIFEQNPPLANFLFSLKALEQSLKERTTLVLDQQTTPFNMLQGRTIDQIGSTPNR